MKTVLMHSLRPIALVEVDVIHAEAAEAGVDLGKDRLAGKPGAVRAGAHASVHLGGDDNLVAAGKVPDCATEDLFAVTERIRRRHSSCSRGRCATRPGRCGRASRIPWLTRAAWR